MALTVEPLGPSNLEALRAFLIRDPASNLHLLGLMEGSGATESSAAPALELLGCFDRQEMKAAMFVNVERGQVLPSTPSGPAELDALVAHLSSRVVLRSSFGDESSVQHLVQRLAMPKPPFWRSHRLLSASPDDLGPYLKPTLRLATESDLPQLLPLAARAVRETFGVDPLHTDETGFKNRVLQRIRNKRTYVLPVDGTLAVKVDIACSTQFGAELDGVYTLPEYRRRGFATGALGQLSRKLLSALPRLTLRADDRLVSTAQKVGYRCGSTPQLLVTDSPL